MPTLIPQPTRDAHAGEWVRYSTPEEGGAVYIAVCLPVFSMETVHRDGN